MKLENENLNEPQNSQLKNSQLNISTVSSTISFSLPKQKRVMFKFDDDEPTHLNSIVDGGEFIISLKEGKIKFEKDGKSFELYIE